jgi:hypothetical protein
VPALLDLPCAAAVDALGLVHAEERATYRAGPLGCLLDDKALYPDSLDALEICENAYPVFCAVAVIEMQQIDARVFGAGRAELMTAGGKFLTVPYGTSKARVRLVAVAPPATGARIAVPNECAAEAAIHAARRNDRRITCLNSRDFVRHAVPVISGASVAHDAQLIS